MKSVAHQYREILSSDAELSRKLKTMSQLFIEDITLQLFQNWKGIFIPFLIVFFSFLILTVLSLQNKLSFSPEYLSRDPLALAKLPFFYGLFSNIGILLWISAAACTFLCASILNKGKSEFTFMIASCIFTVWLALDDLLTFHENVFSNYFYVSENITYLAYLLIILIYLFYFRNDIYTKTNYIILVAALGAFVCSILIDVFWGFTFAEDGAKLLGILLWVIYYFNTARNVILKYFYVLE